MRIASIDIGTNTFRILVSDVKENTSLEQLYLDRTIIRLGGGFSEEDKVLAADAISRALSTLKKYSIVLEKYSVDKVRAVATSVVREALNSRAFIQEVRDKTGINIDVITAEEEARLTLEGVLNSVTLDSPCCIVFDIGGGSTEYILTSNEYIHKLISINMGVVHLTEKYLPNCNHPQPEIEELTDNIVQTLHNELSAFKPLIPDQGISLVATAGTPTTLAAIELGLSKYNPDRINNFHLTRDMVIQSIEKLLALPVPQRTNVPGLEEGREDIIIPGAIILLKTMEYLNKQSLTVSDGGLLEGILYDML